MNKMTIFPVIIMVALGFSLGTTMQSKAQGKNYSGIMPFVTSNNRVGFLDQSNGRIYIYDSNIVQCLFIGQIESLGQPINVVSANNVNTLNR